MTWLYAYLHVVSQKMLSYTNVGSIMHILTCNDAGVHVAFVHTYIRIMRIAPSVTHTSSYILMDYIHMDTHDFTSMHVYMHDKT